jgi:hypothetical protein
MTSPDPIKEEIPKGNPEFATGLFETGEDVPTASPQVAAGTAADLSFLDIVPDTARSSALLQCSRLST